MITNASNGKRIVYKYDMHPFVEGDTSCHYYRIGSWQECQEQLFHWAKAANNSSRFTCAAAFFANPVTFVTHSLTKFISLGLDVNPVKPPTWLTKDLRKLIRTPIGNVCRQLSRAPTTKFLSSLPVVPVCYVLSEQTTPLRKLLLFLGLLTSIASYCTKHGEFPITGDHHVFVKTKEQGLIPEFVFLGHEDDLKSTSSTSSGRNEFLKGLFEILLNFFPFLFRETFANKVKQAKQKQDHFAEQWTTMATGAAFLKPLQSLFAAGLEAAQTNYKDTFKKLGCCAGKLEALIEELEPFHLVIGIIRHDEAINFDKAIGEPLITYEDEKGNEIVLENMYADTNMLMLNNGFRGEPVVFCLAATNEPKEPDTALQTPSHLRAFCLSQGFLPKSQMASKNRTRALRLRLQLLFQDCECENECKDPNHCVLNDSSQLEPLAQVQLLDQALMEQPLSSEAFQTALTSCKHDGQPPPATSKPSKPRASGAKKMQWGLVQNKSKERSALRHNKSLRETAAAESAAIANPKSPAKEGIGAHTRAEPRNLYADLSAVAPTAASSESSGGNGSPSSPAQTGPGLKAAASAPAVTSSDTNDDKGSASSPEKASLDLQGTIDSVKGALLQPKAAKEAAQQ